jgi:hypothetical protein
VKKVRAPKIQKKKKTITEKEANTNLIPNRIGGRLFGFGGELLRHLQVRLLALLKGDKRTDLPTLSAQLYARKITISKKKKKKKVARRRRIIT